MNIKFNKKHLLRNIHLSKKIMIIVNAVGSYSICNRVSLDLLGQLVDRQDEYERRVPWSPCPLLFAYYSCNYVCDNDDML